MLQVTEAQKKGAAAGGAGIREGAGFVNFLVIFFLFSLSFLALSCGGAGIREGAGFVNFLVFFFLFLFLFFPCLSFLFFLFFSSFLLFFFFFFFFCLLFFSVVLFSLQGHSRRRRRYQVAVTCAGGVKLPLHGDMCCRNRPNTNVVPKIKTADVATHK